MSLTLAKVHEWAAVPGQPGEIRLIRTRNYMRLRGGTIDDPPLFVQDGVVYAEGGAVITELPEWFWPAAQRCTAEARAAVKLVLPEEARSTPAAAPETPPKRGPGRPPNAVVRNMWTCDLPGCCAKTMPARAKGLHKMAFQRAMQPPPDAFVPAPIPAVLAS
jgi:hypothetical protein